jgi:Fe-S cluster assembly scaffold protein SufB|tara:strand:+ start:1296 stop:2480 length:1185 start_codon:yes stop_codon:yes gene_type:complete
MPEVNYKTSELFQLLDMGLRDNMLTNPDSSMHSLAKTIHATTLETGNPLFNKFYKNMKINALQEHINTATDDSNTTEIVHDDDETIVIDDGLIDNNIHKYKWSADVRTFTPFCKTAKFELYQDYFQPTGRISDLALMNSIGPVGIKIGNDRTTEFNISYIDKYKDKDMNCIVAVIDCGEHANIEIEELFVNKEGCKIYKILYIVRDRTRLKIKRTHDAQGINTGLNVIETQVVQFPGSSFKMEVSGNGSKYTQDLVFVDSYRDCKTDIKGRFNCGEDSINNMVVNIHHKDINSTSNVDVKSVLDSNAYSSFLGNIIVDKDAIDIKAHLTNKNLLLSETASAVSEPQLDINTKEIECTHGCTISNINKDDLYYLNSKGISTLNATTILKESFLKL